MRALGGVILACAVSACGTARLALDPDPGPYDLFPAGERITLRTARTAFEGGNFEVAAGLLTELTQRHPEHLPTRTFLQDVELSLLEAGLPVGELAAPAALADAERVLLASYLARAEEAPSAAAFVLAARLEQDPDPAFALLDRAAELDPDCIWVHYGRSFRLFALRRFPEAREAMAKARALDPGHLPTIRLYASMRASAGDTDLAIQALTAWLDRTERDPVVPPAHRAEALCDLAALLVLDGRERASLSLLTEVRGELLQDRSRVELVRAAAHQGQGELDLALAAARHAWELGAESLLPLVQEAMLISQSEGDLQGEREVWERLLEAAAQERKRRAERPAGPGEGGVDFQSLLIQLMAHSRLERLRRSEPGLGGGSRP